jgi:hypothetical protein
MDLKIETGGETSAAQNRFSVKGSNSFSTIMVRRHEKNVFEYDRFQYDSYCDSKFNEVRICFYKYDKCIRDAFKCHFIKNVLVCDKLTDCFYDVHKKEYLNGKADFAEELVDYLPLHNSMDDSMRANQFVKAHPNVIGVRLRYVYDDDFSYQLFLHDEGLTGKYWIRVSLTLILEPDAEPLFKLRISYERDRCEKTFSIDKMDGIIEKCLDGIEGLLPDFVQYAKEEEALREKDRLFKNTIIEDGI